MEIPGEKLVIKLWDTLAEKGIGNLLRPWQLRREGQAAVDVRRAEMLALAQAEIDAAAIRSGQKALLVNGELVDRPALIAPSDHGIAVNATSPLPLPLPYVAEIADQNAKAEAMRQEVSVAKAVLYAEEELQRDTTAPPEDSPHDDWLLRWRECAAGVSSEELQQLWGKVLAGEVKSPGRFSLRALEFLRNLSQGEAQAIERISPFVVSGVIYRGEDSVLEEEGVKFTDLLAMQELGVLAGVEAFGLQVTWESEIAGSFRKVLTCHGTLLWITAPDATKVITLEVCSVTAIGKQVLRLGSFSPNAKMLESLAKKIKTLGYEVQLGSYIEVGNNQIKFFNLHAI
ncbi:DUF2806 domain-containing protein [Paracidovorax citrulli]|uniref:DUF2806 domain-containing protein n=1 Tax=Paracidovorax citrulli TaxID=80869 RepID=UPI000890324F|nr:DUF2806 domain-containing protein [Paracidovorax citrulli]UMT89403.1 DUF2806 domain-containing protein [Paracidovorax citrulli]WIY35840.1 DUF2806 domain-containing protein [Paracidovorax citrulli]SDL12266.1 Protein of unknown function [Paracidovorax citrulli]